MGRLPRDRSYAEKKFAIVMEGLKSGKVRRVGRARPEPRLSILGRSYVSVDVIAADVVDYYLDRLRTVWRDSPTAWCSIRPGILLARTSWKERKTLL
jgi:hypothetical protein